MGNAYWMFKHPDGTEDIVEAMTDAIAYRMVLACAGQTAADEMFRITREQARAFLMKQEATRGVVEPSA